MNVLAYRVGQEPKEILTHPDFNCIYLLVCNEEGKIQQLPLNRQVYNYDGALIDIICGDFFICRATEDDFTGIEIGDIEAIDYMECIGEVLS